MTVSPLSKPEGQSRRSDYLRYLWQLGQADLSSFPVPPWRQQLHHQAGVLLQAQAIPGPQEEEWRATSLAGLLELEWTAAQAPQVITKASPEAKVWSGRVGDLLAGDECFRGLGDLAGLGEVFTTLNAACFTTLTVVRLQPGQVVAAPVELKFAIPPGVVTFPRLLVVAAAGSSLTLLEEYVSTGAGPSLTLGVTEVYLEPGAQVSHVRLQDQGTETYHLGRTLVSQAKASRYQGCTLDKGGQLSRHDLTVCHQGPAAQTNLAGLTLARGDQVSDTHTAIIHAHPQGFSRQLHKGIIADRAQGVFRGKVVVPQTGQLTDAGQLNRNLLLSSRARVDTQPQLEITADNVKCTHGATVSHLLEEEMFYIQSRGLDRLATEQLLLRAFAAEIIQQIPLASRRLALMADLTFHL